MKTSANRLLAMAPFCTFYLLDRDTAYNETDDWKSATISQFSIPMSFRTQLEISTTDVIVNLQYKLANRIAQL